MFPDLSRRRGHGRRISSILVLMALGLAMPVDAAVQRMSGIALIMPAQAHAQSAEAEALSRAAPIIADYLDVDVSRVVPEARIVEDLGADDLDRVELVMLMEDEFIVEISDEKLDRMVTVADLVAAAIGR